MKATSTRAFTLLELLVAVSITLVVAALMLAVTTGVLSAWRRTQAGHSQAAAARQVFELLEQDLQSAIHRRDAGRWLAADIMDTPSALANHGWLTGPGVMKPASGDSLRPLPPGDANGGRLIESARFGLSGVWLRFVAASVEAGGSLPVMIAYQVVRRPVTGDPVPSNPAPTRYSLYRSAISQADTFARGYDVAASGYASADNRPYAAASMIYRAPRNAMNPAHANLLASNVVDFGCWLHVRDADGSLRRIYPAAAGDESHHAIGNSTSYDSRFPDVADVMIRILTDAGATELEAIETARVPNRPPAFATDADWWWAVVEANSTVFMRRIEIKATAP